ncbi:MAG: 16S rRNA (guanine(966)-N(2))-methyltransferase RsmD [Myxococcales bacterium]|nr:16S rRNA (guanine(966)-N(2))-methyltransferase RsmD [Myxococcales bacterium]
MVQWAEGPVRREDEALRITGGSLRGRRIHTPASRHLRPALERVREAIFSILLSRLPDARVLDAFAGTGLLGLECLSRGAAEVVFVEQHRPTAGYLEELLAEWRLADRARVMTADFIRAAHHLGKDGPFDLVFLDPPYPKHLLVEALQATAAGRLVKPEGLVIVKRHPKEALTAPAAFAVYDERRYGDSMVTFFKLRMEGETCPS